MATSPAPAAPKESGGGLAAFAIRRPTLIASLVAVMLVIGLLSLSRLGLDQFPDVSFPVVSIVTPYRGVGPSEIETLVSRPIEEQVGSVSGLKHISSTSQDGVSIVIAEFSQGSDVKWAQQQVRDKVALVRPSLPKDVDEPLVRLFDPADQPIVQLALSATLSAGALYDLADLEIRPRLEQVPNVSVVQLVGGTKRQIYVDLDASALQVRSMSVGTVAARIAASSQNVPVGELSRNGERVLLRSVGEYRSLDEIRRVPVSFFAGEVSVPVASLGEVRDGTEEVRNLAFYNGQPAIFVNIFRQSGSNTVQVVDRVLERIQHLNESLASRPGAPTVAVVRDNAKYVRLNVEDVRDTILLGALLTIFVVYLFLGNFRSTFITGMALPNSLIGTFILMYAMGFTINLITLLALSLAVGLLIDDAIVVRENIWRHLENGAPPREAAVRGTNEVLLAVVATSLTVISVFLPIGFLSGIVGQFFRQLGFTVAFAMTISLFDALTIAPLLSAYLAGRRAAPAGEGARPGFARRLAWTAFLVVSWPFRSASALVRATMDRLTGVYESTIRFCLGNRALVLGGALALFVVSVALLGPRIKNTFIPASDIGFYQVTLEAAPSASLEAMQSESRKIEEILRAHPENRIVARQVGNAEGEPNVASFFLEMVPWRQRSMSTTQMKEMLRAELVPFAHLSPVVGDVQAVGNISPFNLNLIGDDLPAMAKAAGELKAALAKIPGLVDLRLNFQPGKPEYRIAMDPTRARDLGVSTTSAGMELRAMVAGAPAAKFRDGGREYDVLVRLREDQRDLSQRLGAVYVPNMNQTLIPLTAIADVGRTTGPSKINRRDRSRYIQIAGELGPGGALGNIQRDAEALLKKTTLPAGVTHEFVGQAEDLKELGQNMAIAMGLGILFMYLILASLYESVLVPFLIMLALPFAIVGALTALYATNESLNIFSMIAMVMLLGLVAKNSILLVDYTLHLMRAGLPRHEAIVQAGKTRLRPILMTTVALIAGMLPLALGLSEVGRFRRSMGIAVIGGLAGSLILTLVIVPAAFEWVDRFRLWSRRLLGRPPLREVDSD